MRWSAGSLRSCTFHDAMPRHRTVGPRLSTVASAPRWSTGPPWAACSNRWPCLKCWPRRGAVLAPGSALAANSGLWVRSAVASPLPPPSLLPLLRGWPGALSCPLATLDIGPPRRGALRVPAEADCVCVVVRVSPPVLRRGLRWLRGFGVDPVGCRL